jgi:carboxyl-terminal processing protease
MTCEEAQRVTAFMRDELAVPAIAPMPGELGQVWADILDPHGLWSAAPDSPVRSELAAAAPDMLGALHDREPGCAAARAVARALDSWLTQLAVIYDAAFDAARSGPVPSDAELFRLVAEPIFQDDPVTQPAQELARELGGRLGVFVARFPEEMALVEDARARFLPASTSDLSGIVTLAALRAYVPLVDPHADFAPLDEEWALYAGDTTLDGGSSLWADMARTPLGARIVDDPTPPLQLDDLVLSINGLSLAGASLDQIEQAARSAQEGDVLSLRVLRQGQAALLALSVDGVAPVPETELELERIDYGAGQMVLRVVIPDVGDWLGEDLAEVLAHDAGTASALLLDLRGNGGGSLDAAVEALGLMLPDAPLFPLIRRGVVSEVLQAPRPPTQYGGPVAALVDGDTASAAEMLAGGLQAYGRGLVIGARTFGKGCVQEYFDDVAASGVLRLTTLQFVMPSGKPLQQIGLTPDIALALAPALERESQITRQPISFGGPDVRDRRARVGPTWPRSKGPPGPCRDPVVCMALARLSGAESVLRAARGRGARAP